MLDPHLCFRHVSGKRLHLGVCGSVAAYRMLDLMRRCQEAGLHVSVTLTRAAQEFITPMSFEALGAAPVYGNLFQAELSPFEHLEPGQSAHALLVAPASADMLARMAQGLADDMLSCQLLAFDGPVLVAPAMNPRMWSHPATQANVELLRSRDVMFVGPESGKVACGDQGAGRLADWRSIYLATLKALTPQDMEGRTVMVTLGPTRETWDAVRFWSNGSTGVMGASLAVAAWLRGANVHAVCGPVDIWLPSDPSFHRHNVNSAAQMLECAKTCWHQADLGLFTAAVADFRPEAYGAGKFKKQQAGDGFSLRFVPNQDILRLLAAEKGTRQVVGFAAESVPDADALAHAVRRKLVHKNADLVVGNQIADGFGKPDNRVFVADIRGREEHWPPMPKPEVAWNILDRVMSL